MFTIDQLETRWQKACAMNTVSICIHWNVYVDCPKNDQQLMCLSIQEPYGILAYSGNLCCNKNLKGTSVWM